MPALQWLLGLGGRDLSGGGPMRALEYSEVIILGPISMEVLGALQGADEQELPEHFSHL